MKRHYVLVLLIALLGCATVKVSDAPKEIPTNKEVVEVLITGGTILTMEDAEPKVEAIALKDGKIAWIGKQKDIAQFKANKVIDLNGRTLMPGLIQQHLHPTLGALTLSIPVIAPEDWELPTKTWKAAKSEAAYREILKQEVQHFTKGGTFFSWGFHQYFHGNLDRTILDEMNDTIPIVIWHRSCHEFYLNTAAIQKYGIDQEKVNASGLSEQVNLEKGHFYENAAFVYLLPLIMPELANPKRFVAGLQQMVQLLHQGGVTAFNEPGGVFTPDILQLYQLVLGAESTPMSTYLIPEARTLMMEHGIEGVLAASQEVAKRLPATGKVRFFDKHIKLFLDGAIISQLMQMKDGYLDGHHGEWMQTPEELDKVMKVYWEEGYQIHVHVNGDLGLEKLLDIVEKRMKENPRKDHRTTIVHFANSTDEQVQRIADLGLIVSANPYYVTAFSNKYSQIGLGHDRAESMVRLGPVEKLGIPISLHSDLPMAPAAPLYLAWAAVTRITHEGGVVRPDLALSVDAALKAITIGSAHSWGMEKEIGSIAVGKTANLTLLAENPYEVEKQRLKDIKVIGTYFEGKYYPVK